ncbi:MAG: sulfate adenylyltransferase [Frankiales bacterium]|nr:sulfate adenylyltransferase [Frankiales bacterium]
MTEPLLSAAVLHPDGPASPRPLVDPAPRDLLRLAVAGSVDDGKSTLVGRLLHDTRSVLSDTLASVERASRERGLVEADLALLTDGLRAEREQGITIDVAHRYFTTPRRSFVLADTPGHVEYTRNMVTGASTAELALVLVDARRGVVEQTRRHAAVTALLGVRHVALVVNKMDLVGFDPEVYAAIRADFATVASALGLDDVVPVPVSALHGDNVVTRSDRMPWHHGPTLLEHLEGVPVGTEPDLEPFRFPVQVVLRPRTAEHPDYRGLAGRVAHGVVRVGDPVVVLPSGRETRVAAIDGLDGPLDAASAMQSVVLRLADDVDAARGDLLAGVAGRPLPVRELEATVCVLADRVVEEGAQLLVHHGTRTTLARVGAVRSRLDLVTLDHVDDGKPLALNDIGRVSLRLAEPLPIDDYRELRRTGAFLLVDRQDGTTLAAGMAALGR